MPEVPTAASYTARTKAMTPGGTGPISARYCACRPWPRFLRTSIARCRSSLALGVPTGKLTANWNVVITVSGPVVPGEGLPYQADATTCTWTVAMHDLTGPVPVSAADFHSVDHLGSVFVMGLVRGEAPPPRLLRAGQKLTFQLRAYELVGEGMMQWAPDRKHVVAYWDYTVEND